jgi:cystathionine gamma-synthase
MAVFQALAAGDHVVVSKDTYHGTPMILRTVMERWGLRASFVDTTKIEDVAAAFRPETRLLWIETPSNPLMRVSDIERLAGVAHQRGAMLVADNTVATPVLQNPLKLGCDLVVHSTTKYVSGPSDVLGGAVVTRERSELWERLRAVQHYGGAVPSPFDCWLSLRGIRTMPQRVRAQSANALAVAEALRGHPGVEAVYYAGLSDHPGHELAARQMRGFGGLLSFNVRGGEKAAFAVAAGLEMITRATSLGGVESTIEHRASMEPPGSTTPNNLLRLSVGIELASDLIADLRQALDKAGR